LVKQAHFEEAIPYLRKAVENRPDYVAARVMLGRSLMELKKWSEAIEALEAATRTEPRHPQPHFLLSQVYFRMGETLRAKQEKEISLRLRRQNPRFLEAVQGRPFPHHELTR
jgi:predicted Zn-dependent protease